MDTKTPGRWSELHGGREAQPDELRAGMDFRLPQYRRAVFQLFYGFHLKHRSHPGCVYYLLPELANRLKWSMEDRLWFAFLNGNTQNPITSLIIFRRFPNPFDKKQMATLPKWFEAEKKRLFFDTDRRHHKPLFPQSVDCYLKLMKGSKSQERFFRDRFAGSPTENFNSLWPVVYDTFETFGRLSAFSYLEYLSLSLPIEASGLMLDDIEGSKSHRNGLCRVLGREDLDWHESNPSFDGKYSPKILEWLTQEGERLLFSCRQQFRKETFYGDGEIDYFSLESALCTYKSWHRPNRRYPNCYNDMAYNRLREADKAWCWEDLDIFREIRKDCVPEHLRVEDNFGDPGLSPEKQNHYLNTGQVIMMDREYPCFQNDFNDLIRSRNDATLEALLRKGKK